MLLLADENFPSRAVSRLRQRGHDVFYVVHERPGLSDIEVFSLAVDAARILLTFDKGFGQIARSHKASGGAGVILFRLSIGDPDDLADAICEVVDSRSDWSGSLSVANNNGIRTLSLRTKPA